MTTNYFKAENFCKKISIWLTYVKVMSKVAENLFDTSCSGI